MDYPEFCITEEDKLWYRVTRLSSNVFYAKNGYKEERILSIIEDLEKNKKKISDYVGKRYNSTNNFIKKSLMKGQLKVPLNKTERLEKALKDLGANYEISDSMIIYSVPGSKDL